MNLSSNRINQNAPRNARNARPMPNHAPAQRPQVQQANTLSNYGTTTRVKSLYPGQVIKGEVTDLRNTEIVVTLENNTTVAGHLENGSWLAIGETAAFRVASVSAENILLSAIPGKDMSLANSTIQKALEEAGLPKNAKNQQIVMELMNNQLPIHKQAIQQILQQSFLNKDIQIPTLVLMNKLQIPITEKNASQLEHYQNNEHALATGLQSLSEDLGGLIKGLFTDSLQTEASYEGMTQNIHEQNTIFSQEENLSPKDALINQLLHTKTTQSSSEQTLQATASKILSAVLDEDSAASSFSKTVLQDLPLELASEAEKNELISILDNFDFPSSLKEAIQNNAASLREVIHLIQKDYDQAQMLDQASIAETEPSASQTEQKITAAKNSTENEPLLLRTSAFDSPVIKNLTEQFQRLQLANGELGGRVSKEECRAFYDLLKDFPIDETVKEKVLTGEIHTTELLRTIKNVLPFTAEEIASPLLASDTFEQLVKDEFLDSFLLSPKEIFEQGGVDTFYKKLSKQLDNLEEVFGKHVLSHSTENIEQIVNTLQHNPQEQVGQLKDNLDFMKLLNQFFSYVQLPVKLQKQCTHADLYVYTKKKNLKNQQNPIHVLLHLDMDNLGTMDVDIKLKDRHVTTKFVLSDEKAGKLLSNNFHVLEDALLQKGYTCSSEVTKSEQKVDLVKDFLQPERAASQGLSRYSFDLRA